MTKDFKVEGNCHRCGKPIELADLPHGGPGYCGDCVERKAQEWPADPWKLTKPAKIAEALKKGTVVRCKRSECHVPASKKIAGVWTCGNHELDKP